MENKPKIKQNSGADFIDSAKVKSHPIILEFIRQTENSLKALSYTEHGLRHATLVSDRARNIAQKIDLPAKQIELAAIAGFCHDMGNFMGRFNHHYWGAILFSQVFLKDFSPRDLAAVMQAIANHDKEDMRFTNPVSAVVVLADKSDVDRKRVIAKNLDEIKADIHDRVNFATTNARLKVVDKETKKIILTLKIDTNFVPIMEYFEIFTERMTYCRTAAEYLGYDFDLVINNIELL
jgi:uncharacterized protein